MSLFFVFCFVVSCSVLYSSVQIVYKDDKSKQQDFSVAGSAMSSVGLKTLENSTAAAAAALAPSAELLDSSTDNTQSHGEREESCVDLSGVGIFSMTPTTSLSPSEEVQGVVTGYVEEVTVEEVIFMDLTTKIERVAAELRWMLTPRTKVWKALLLLMVVFVYNCLYLC